MAVRSRSPARRPGDDSAQERPVWLITFADMTMLLLCFFIFMVALMSPSDERLKEALKSIQTYLGKKRVTRVAAQAFVSTTYAKPIEQDILREPIPTRPDARRQDEGTRATMRSVYFGEGKVALSPATRASLSQIADDLRGYPSRIEVRGHAAGGESADTWTLSWQRALAVGRHLMAAGKIDPVRLRLCGCGDVDPAGRVGARPEPGGAKAADRRVEIIGTGEYID